MSDGLRKVKLAKQRVRSARWRAAHRDALVEYYARYRKDHGLSAYHAAYYQKNKERWRKQSTAKPLLAPEEKRRRKSECDRVYRQKNRENINAAIARAKAAKPEHYRAIQTQSSLRRRARRRSLPVESVSHKAIRVRDGMRCHLCGALIHERVTFDHLIPVVRSGAYAEWNLMLAHDLCNKRRSTKAIIHPETREEAERYIASCLARYAQEMVA